MGRASLEGMLEVADVETVLRWHLGSNHYPPIPEVYDAAREAIDLANAGEWDALVKLPKGVTYRGRSRAPVTACVGAWHLDGFLGAEDDAE